ncbi:cation:dicarboxylase symporter family transporter [Desulfofundulus thermobenzoicus]|uniref:Cation:dicarboxylase symporter family transporter n=1 Tax=Desulfofundulus thermobenzoicus TaxID=29376 RepID=A0A6N7IP08_9FIRM|nr:dicarboxylate/amino acid:cation symporter [Desulfofundulus thermobenzoicus]MQL51343.1 cation:dicarboxylase symporter family transporter [Desulfofundulus thermobenzoicus]HHW42648.1 dicarboxylate/amino acid:cation symporter [Desulfotomaculum sp.]
MENAANSRRRLPPLWLQILIGLVVGGIIGTLWHGFGAALQPIGTLFIKAIKMIVIPLVFSAVTLGIYKMGSDLKQLGRLGALAFIWFYVATGISIILGIALNGIFHPAAGVVLQATGKLPENLATSIDWVKFFTDIVPDNIVSAMAGQKIIPTLFFAICFGISLAGIGEKAKVVVDFLEGILNSMFKLTQGVVATAPVAVAAIMAWVFATQGGSVIWGMAKLIGLMYVGLLIIMVIFWIIVAALGLNPFATTRKVMEPLLLAFTTCSSEVTLPVHMNILEKTGIPNKIVSFVLPLGYSFNLDGAALYQSLAVCFLAEAYGLHLDMASILTILLTTLIANKGTANVPAASLVVLAVILSSLNLPMEAIAILAGVDRFMDMGRTTINVFGNTIAAVLLYKFGGKAVAEDDGVASVVGV